jgi:general secretion pathway protein D
VHRSKAILVLCPTEYQQSVRDIITELDKPGRQVLVKAIIVEVNHEDMTSLGIRLASSAPGLNLAADAIAALSELTYAETFGSIALTSGLNANVIVDLLVKETDARVLLQPSLWTKDNAEANVFKGWSVPFLKAAQSSAEGTSTKTEVEYRPVGVTLRVRPNITPERAVDLIINLVISQVEPELINNTTVTSEMNTTTKVIVQDGQTILISGILVEAEKDIEHKIPFLGDLPLLGGLFRHTETVQSNNELLAFITPYVLSEPHGSPHLEQELDQAKQKLKEIREDLEGPPAPEPE